tara:strand:+ start:18200 stop:18442 length:243 start_codon:yes stop_codon:yes gene_type:complete
MSDIIIEYWDNKKLVHTFNKSGDEEKIFRDVYNKNRELRYCDRSYFKLKNKEDEQRYFEWINKLSRQTRFDMYYGNDEVE